MALAVAFCCAVLAAGFGALKLLGLNKGLVGPGFAPSAGLALLAILTTWTTLLGAPPLTGTLVLVGLALSGVILALTEYKALRLVLSEGGEHRLALAILGIAVVVPAVILGLAFGSLEVPFSTHDGAHHVETIQAMRSGQGWQGWYPPGYHATLAAFLGLVPWVDSALGTFQISFGLTLLGQLAVFGLGCAVLHRPLISALGALLLGLTYKYPYTVHIWALWPMVDGLIVVTALWSAGFYYLRTPSVRWAVLCGLLAAGIGLTHTVEVYTAALGMPFILAAHWRTLRWRHLARDATLATGIALLLVLPYLPPVIGWARGGGAVDVGTATGSTADGRLGPTGGIAMLLLDLTGGFLLDAPFRLAVVCIGAWWALRQPNGRALVATACVFLLVPLALVYVDVAPVRWVFAATFPWSHGYRLFMVAAPLLALLGGAGVVCAGDRLGRLRRLTQARRRLAQAASGLGLLVAFGGLVLVPNRLATEGTHDSSYLPDDAAAMAWLGAHARPGEVLANDWASDAGIWAPYRAGVRVLFPRLDRGEQQDARLVIAGHIASLDQSTEARAAACALGVRYVYTSMPASRFWDSHRFPPRDQLRMSSALEEVFTSGDASIFRTRLDCHN